MLIAKNHSMLNDNSFPYIRDGLIAMYDGEFNIGWNMHSDNPPTWLDCITRTPMIFKSEADVVFQKKYVGYKIPTNSSTEYYGSAYIPGLSSFPELFADVCLSIEGFTWGHAGIVGLKPAGYSKGLCAILRGGGADTNIAGFGMFGGNYSSGKYNQSVTFSSKNAFTAYFPINFGSNSARVIFNNGGGITCSSDKSAIVPDVPNDLIVIGFRFSTYEPAAKMGRIRLHRLSIYTRILSQDERTYNFQIDKTRFKIG